MAIKGGPSAQIWRQPRSQDEHLICNCIASVYLQMYWVKILRTLLVVLLVASFATVERPQLVDGNSLPSEVAITTQALSSETSSQK